MTSFMEDLNERPATRADYPSLAKMLPMLRNKGDANPAICEPHKSVNLQYGHHCDCLTNTARYIEQHPDAVPVKCFRIWIAPFSEKSENGLAISAQVHIIPMHNGKYVEVTPPEMGDEGLHFMIVPTSRAYPDYSAAELIRLHHEEHLRLRLGGVFWPQYWLDYQQKLRGPERAQGDALDLVCYACPFVHDITQYMTRDEWLLEAEDCDGSGRLLFQLSVLLKVIDAKRTSAEDKSEAVAQVVEVA